MLEKTLESTLDSKEIKPINPKGNQSWIVIRRTDAEAETPLLWPPDTKSQLIEKDPDTEKDQRQEERGWQRMRWLMASLTQWTWVWTSSRRWWKTVKPGLLQSMGLQRVGHDWVLEQQQNCKHYTLSAEVRRRVVWWLEPASTTFLWKTSEDVNQSEWQETQESMCLFPLMA